MPDPNSASKPEPTTTSNEFDFDVPVRENPRLKRRSLKVKPTESLTPVPDVPPSARELEREAPPLSAEAVRPEHQPTSEHDADAEINAAVKFTEPTPAATQPPAATTKPATGYTPRTTPSTNPPASPHGTRPATLYYSQRKDKEEPSPMKTTPTAGPTSSPATSSSPTRPAAAASMRPATVVDYRTNIDRQAREQKSIGGVLSLIVYVLIGFFVLSATLAGYGIYALSIQLKQQSLTIDQLDKHYAAKNQELSTQLTTTIETLTQAQAQIGREQELILKQQEALNKLITANDAAATALKQERQARANETASLRSRVTNLENRGISR